MQNNRDSSILRSLAVAFGDGLAFGVGMKLSQKAARAVEPPSRVEPAEVDLSPVLERLEEIEKRVSRVEHTPRSIAAPAAPATPAPFDQKVLEAIVNALDARLLEQAGQVERRLNELDAKMAAELKLLQQQDRSVANRVQTHIEELNGQFNDQLAAISRRSDEERAAVQREIVLLHREFAEQAAQTVENRVTELRQEIAARDSQIAELRARLEAGDQSLRNVASAIAQACQSVAPRTAPTAAAEPTAAPVPLVSLQ